MNALSWMLAFGGYLLFIHALLSVRIPFFLPAQPEPACAFLYALSNASHTRISFERTFNGSCPVHYRFSDALELVHPK